MNNSFCSAHNHTSSALQTLSVPTSTERDCAMATFRMHLCSSPPGRIRLGQLGRNVHHARPWHVRCGGWRFPPPRGLPHNCGFIMMGDRLHKLPYGNGADMLYLNAATMGPYENSNEETGCSSVTVWPNSEANFMR